VKGRVFFTSFHVRRQNENLDNQFVAWLSLVLPAQLLTVALSVLSYFALERPFLRIKSRFTLVPNRAD
jgi:peptidoglycan/LPS O-acetylase OafA/YrhL